MPYDQDITKKVQRTAESGKRELNHNSNKASNSLDVDRKNINKSMGGSKVTNQTLTNKVSEAAESAKYNLQKGTSKGPNSIGNSMGNNNSTNNNQGYLTEFKDQVTGLFTGNTKKNDGKWTDSNKKY